MSQEDVWDTIKFTPEIKQRVDELLQDSNLAVERRGETTYYPAKLFIKNKDNRVVERKVIVADRRTETLTIISTSFIDRSDYAVLVMRLNGHDVRQLKGKIYSSRPGKRQDDRADGKLRRFIAGFKPARSSAPA